MYGHRPDTVDEAVEMLIANLTEDARRQLAASDRYDMHFGLGMAIRNSWIYGNPVLTADCGSMEPDDLSALIIDRARHRLRETPADQLPDPPPPADPYPPFRVEVEISDSVPIAVGLDAGWIFDAVRRVLEDLGRTVVGSESSQCYAHVFRVSVTTIKSRRIIVVTNRLDIGGTMIESGTLIELNATSDRARREAMESFESVAGFPGVSIRRE